MSEINMAGDVRAIGGQMANVLFNLAQRPGEPLDAAACESLDTLRRQWDAAVRASPSTSGDERNAALNRAFDEGVKFGKEAAREEAAMLCNTHAQEQHKFHQHAEMYVADHLAQKIRALKTATPSPIKAEPTTLHGLHIDEQRLQLWRAVEQVKIGNKSDDKLILRNLHKNGYCIAPSGTPSLPPQGEAQAERDREVGKKWREDSSLDSWFPFSAEELASTKRMFQAACSDLGLINKALGIDPDDGGAEPILDAIAELKAAIAPQGQQAAESNEWVAEAKLTLDRLASFLQAIGAPHAVAWRDWIDNAERHLLDAPPGQQAKAVAPEYLKLRFFRDLNDAQRLAVFEVFGLLPAEQDEVKTHGIQSRLFDKLIATRTAQALPVAGTASADAWYLQDRRSYVGNDVLWWAKGGKGYTTDISKAEVYTREDPRRLEAARGADLAWPKQYIDAKTRPAVDMQYINHAEAIASLQQTQGSGA